MTRVVVDLVDACEAGADLGSRVHHIHTVGGALRQLSAELDTALVTLCQSLEDIELPNATATAALRRLVEDVAILADSAQRFPIDS